MQISDGDGSVLSRGDQPPLGLLRVIEDTGDALQAQQPIYLQSEQGTTADQGCTAGARAASKSLLERGYYFLLLDQEFPNVEQ